MGAPSSPEHCLNCGYNFEADEHYCPQCGQERKPPLPRLKTLFLSFLGDFFTFDSKFFRSLVPLVLQPGQETLDYIKGKQVRYIPPLRMFLFLSLLLILVFNYLVPWQNITLPVQIGASDVNIARIDSLDLEGKDSILLSHEDIAFVKTIQELNAQGYTYREIADSVMAGQGLISKVAFQQALRLQDPSGNKAFVGFLVGNTTIFLLVVLLLMSLWLALFYARSNLPFIGHLIFALHFLSFLLCWELVIIPIALLTTEVAYLAIYPLQLYYLWRAVPLVYEKKRWVGWWQGSIHFLMYNLLLFPIAFIAMLLLSFFLY